MANVDDMKPKPYNMDDHSLDTNSVREPEMTYAYTSPSERDAFLIEKFDKIAYPPQPVFEPDEDFYNSISGEEFKKMALEIVRKVHHKYYGNERLVDPRNA